MSPASLLQFLFIPASALVIVVGLVVTLFAVGALFDALEHQDELSERVLALFRRPLQAAIIRARRGGRAGATRADPE